MENNDKVINFEDIKAVTEEESKEEVVEEVTPVEEASAEPTEESAEEKTDDEEITKDQIEQMLQTAEMMVNVMRDQWVATSKEYQINDAIMGAIGKWNDEHRTPMPEDISEEDREKWDHLNGIDSITEEAVKDIFGEPPHPIYGLTFEDTKANIKAVGETFLGWMTTLREYRNIHDAYTQLIELQEEESLNELKERAQNETDPEKQKSYLDAIDLYYDRKFLGFLAVPLSDSTRTAILDARSDSKKIEYWIKRSREKLDRLKISPTIILELSQFVRRFMGPEYKNNNMLLLLYFVRLTAYCNTDRRDDDDRTKVVCMTMALDALIRKLWNEERTNRLMNNIKAFEDQFLPYVPAVEPDESITPPVEDPISGEPKEEVPVEESTDTYAAPEEEGKMTNIPPEEWTEPAEEAETTNEGNYMLEGISDDFESDGSGD